MSSNKRILLLINPNSRTGEGSFSSLHDELTQAGHHLIPLSYEEKKSDYNSLIRKYQKDIDLVIVGGGDGSLNFILPSLVETQLPVAVFPLGTANLLARSFELKADTKFLLELIENGETTAVDVGKVNGIYFINVCGLGISTEVNGKLPKWLKRLTGPFSFWIMGLWLRKSLRPFKLTLQMDERPGLKTRTWQITVCNGRRYGSWMNIAHDASYDDETLHILSTEVKHWWQGFRLLPAYLRGAYERDLEVTFLSGKRLKVETKKPLKIDVDGDVQTTTPALFEVEPQALKLLLPAQLPENAPLDLTH